MLKSINSATEKSISSYTEHSESEVIKIINQTQKAWKKWKQTESFDDCRHLDVFKPAATAFESKEYGMIYQKLLNNNCNVPNLTHVFPWLSDIQGTIFH